MLESLAAVIFLLQISRFLRPLPLWWATLSGWETLYLRLLRKLLLTSWTWEHSAHLPRETSVIVQSSASLYGHEKKASLKERPKPFPGSKGAAWISITGCGTWVLVIPSSHFRVKWWCFCPWLSSAQPLLFQNLALILLFLPFPLLLHYLPPAYTPATLWALQKSYAFVQGGCRGRDRWLFWAFWPESFLGRVFRVEPGSQIISLVLTKGLGSVFLRLPWQSWSSEIYPHLLLPTSLGGLAIVDTPRLTLKNLMSSLRRVPSGLSFLGC